MERNLGAALPGATFLTERSNPKLKTFRYLGCAENRAVANPDPNTVGLLTGEPTQAPYVTVPDPQCVGKESDKFQEALEFAKSRGDTIAGGVNNATVNTETFRAFVEANRGEIAPQPAGQFTITNVSVVFPGGSTWALPAIVGGIALGTPNNEAWGILNNVNDRFKSAKLTDCSKSKPFAPGCNGVPPISGGAGFSYTVQHEASHFLGLLHPHNTVNVNKAEDGTWTSYADLQSWYANFSMAPTTYFGAFAPYSVNDQDIIQRGHVGEYFQQADDYLQDAVRADAMAGRTSVSPLTTRKMKEVAKWRAQASKLFGCGDNLQSERAARNMYLDSELRFYAAWYAVAGVLMHRAAADPAVEGRVLGPISVGWGLAGTSRLLSTRAVGPPDPVFTALAGLELALAVVLAPRRLRPPLRGDDLDGQRCVT